MAKKYLVIELVGRICMVTDRRTKTLWAVFVKIRCDRKRGLREHASLMSVPLSMVKSQEEADSALLTSATFVKPLKSRQLVDQLGIFSLAGQDMTIAGAADGRGHVEIDKAADLDAIVASVGSKATVNRKIVRKGGSSPFGVTARLQLPSSAKVTAIVEDARKKTFMPGKHTQVLATYVRCEIPFKDPLKPPVLQMRKFTSTKKPVPFRFDAHKYDKLTLTMSNLCNDIGYTEYSGGGMVDDPEFKVYYQLFKSRLPKYPVPILKTDGPRPKASGPIVRKSFLWPPPVPTSRFTLGAISIPVCYFVAQAEAI